MYLVTRRKLLVGGALTAAAIGGAAYWRRASGIPVGFSYTEADLVEATAILSRHMAIDAHAHPGRTFVEGANNLPAMLKLYALPGSFEERSQQDMVAGHLTAAAYAAVADFQTLDLADDGLAASRAFEPGEAWQSYQTQMANLQQLIDDGLVYPVKTSQDFSNARKAGKVGGILAVEGGDFLEGQADRITTAFADGVRMLTLMHYRNNMLGTIITDPTDTPGLTNMGAEVIREMNRVGMVLDLAHASTETAFDALEIATKPAIASHVHINSKRLEHPRFIPSSLAKAIADQGGLIGAWPAGIGISSLSGFVDRTIELTEFVGVDHVCIGSDMDANYKPVFENYRKLPLFVVGLLQRGMPESDIAKILGENFIRLFEANLTSS